MLTKIIPEKIPLVWELIKFASTQIDDVSEKDRLPYLNELLHALLSNKAQCWVRSERDRVKSINITRIGFDKITGRKFLQIQLFYAFEKSSEEEWESNFKTTVEFARVEKCDNVFCTTANNKVFEIAERLGFKEISRKYNFEVV